MIKIHILIALLSLADAIFLKDNTIGKIINIAILVLAVFLVFFWKYSIWNLFGFAIVWLLAGYFGGYINTQIKKRSNK